jgi:hypothetical protein
MADRKHGIFPVGNLRDLPHPPVEDDLPASIDVNLQAVEAAVRFCEEELEIPPA